MSTSMPAADAPARTAETTAVVVPVVPVAPRIGLGTRELATALVVRSAPPGHLRSALDTLR